MIYITMFTVSFLSGSLIPLGSEALLIYYIKDGYSLTALLLVATIGNVLGAMLNYWLGSKGEEILIQKGYLSLKAISKAKKSFFKYGYLSLLFSSLPIIGDPLTFIAGALKYNFFKFTILVTISKAIRYIFIAFLI